MSSISEFIETPIEGGWNANNIKMQMFNQLKRHVFFFCLGFFAQEWSAERARQKRALNASAAWWGFRSLRGDAAGG